jgi:hypothetical protein
MLDRQNKGAALLFKCPKIRIGAVSFFVLAGCHHVLLVLAGRSVLNSVEMPKHIESDNVPVCEVILAPARIARAGVCASPDMICPGGRKATARRYRLGAEPLNSAAKSEAYNKGHNMVIICNS